MHDNQNASGKTHGKPSSATPENGSTSEATPDGFVPGADVEKLKADLEVAQKDYLYLRAEMENYKRQAIKERSDLMKFGSERLARELLGVLDVFEKALGLEVSAQNFEAFKKGVEITATELKSVLDRNGVQEIPSHGEVFNPQFHEALGSEPSTMPEGHVTQVFRKAYKFHDRVLRPGQVIISKPPVSN